MRAHPSVTPVQNQPTHHTNTHTHTLCGAYCYITLQTAACTSAQVHGCVLIAQAHGDIFDLQELIKAVFTLLTAQPTLLHTTKGRHFTCDGGIIQPDLHTHNSRQTDKQTEAGRVSSCYSVLRASAVAELS